MSVYITYLLIIMFILYMYVCLLPLCGE